MNAKLRSAFDPLEGLGSSAGLEGPTITDGMMGVDVNGTEQPSSGAAPAPNRDVALNRVVGWLAEAETFSGGRLRDREGNLGNLGSDSLECASSSDDVRERALAHVPPTWAACWGVLRSAWVEL